MSDHENLTAKELDSIRLQIRSDGKMIRAHLKIDGRPAIFIAQMNTRLAEKHPHLFEAFKEWCKVALKTMLDEVLSEVTSAAAASGGEDLRAVRKGGSIVSFIRRPK